VRLLQALEKIAGRKITEMFDLIAGTSTGGIIACGLLAGVSLDQLANLYDKYSGDVFNRNLWRTVVTLDNFGGPKYTPDPLESLLKQDLGEKWLSEIEGPELLVPAYCIQLPEPVPLAGGVVMTSRAPYFFKSWKAAGRHLDEDDVPEKLDFPLWQVARATSAAPTYFPPATVTSRAGEQFTMVDGGVFANNPAMCAVASARHIFHTNEFIVVSLGTGSLERAIDAEAAKGWGEIAWIHPLISILIDGNVDTVCYELEQLEGVRHFRFQISTGTDPRDPATVNEDFDNASVDNISRLEQLAKRLVKIHEAKLSKVARLL
jgi:patatin-like phospholipase/acyl hydrolase